MQHGLLSRDSTKLCKALFRLSSPCDIHPSATECLDHAVDAVWCYWCESRHCICVFLLPWQLKFSALCTSASLLSTQRSRERMHSLTQSRVKGPCSQAT